MVTVLKFWLIWIEGLAAAMLFISYICVHYSRKKKGIWKSINHPYWAVLAITVIGILLTVYAGLLYSGNIQPTWLFAYTLLWTISFLIGSLLVIRRGLQKNEDILYCFTWPRGKLSAAFGIVAGFMLLTFWSMDADVRARIASARAEANAKAITIMPAPVPDRKNAALVYEKAFKYFSNGGKWPEWMLEYNEAILDPASDEVKEFLHKNTKALSLVKKAAAMPDYYLPLEFSIYFPIPEFVPYRNAARLLALNSLSDAARGNSAAAMESIAVIRRIAEHLASLPLVISSLHAISLDSLATRALEKVLAEKHFNPADLNLPVEGDESYLRKGLKLGYSGEDFMLINLLSTELEKGLWETENLDFEFFAFNSSLYRVVHLQYDIEFHKRLLGGLVDLLSKQFYEVNEDFDKFIKSIRENPGGILSSIYAPQYFDYHIKLARAESEQRLSYLALAAAAYHAKHGRYPAASEDLVPDFIAELPVDPFDGKPLKMAAYDGGLILYSVGPDLKDDRGAEFNSKSHHESKGTGDITFVLGSAYKKRRIGS